jgi:hypothetical protein
MKITESQLRQLVHIQLKNVLSEITQPKLVGRPTFGELKKADAEAMTARGTFKDAATGKAYEAKSAFERMSVKDSKEVHIYQSVFNTFTVILNPDGDGSLQSSIGLDTIKRLGINPTATAVKDPTATTATAAKSQAPKQQAGGATAGLPSRNVAEAKLRASIKKQIAKVLKEAMSQQTSILLANLKFSAISAPAGITSLSQYNGKFNGPVETTEPATGKPRTYFAFVYDNTYYITMHYDTYKGNTWNSAWSIIKADLKLTEDKSLPVRFK